jgi:leucine dehydrogenase
VEGVIVVAVHSTLLGPSAGGCRMRTYGSTAEAVHDAHRLSMAMTQKFAACGLPFGGGKSVIAVPSIPTGEARRELLHEVGELVESLGGLYTAAPDMNTSDVDMDVVGERTRHVFCRTAAAGGCGSPAPATADGVHAGMRAAMRHVFGSDDPHGRIVLVQGVGSVGERLARHLAADGAEVVVCDLDAARARRLADDIGGRAVPVDAWLTEACDVFAPCAAGGVLDETTIDSLRCRLVAGAANNQLATPDDATRLADRGITWVPDYVLNAGGVLKGAGLELLGWTPEHVEARVAGIGAIVASLLERADRTGRTTLQVAEDVVAERLADAAASRARRT